MRINYLFFLFFSLRCFSNDVDEIYPLKKNFNYWSGTHVAFGKEDIKNLKQLYKLHFEKILSDEECTDIKVEVKDSMFPLYFLSQIFTEPFVIKTFNPRNIKVAVNAKCSDKNIGLNIKTDENILVKYGYTKKNKRGFYYKVYSFKKNEFKEYYFYDDYLLYSEKRSQWPKEFKIDQRYLSFELINSLNIYDPPLMIDLYIPRGEEQGKRMTNHYETQLKWIFNELNCTDVSVKAKTYMGKSVTAVLSAEILISLFTLGIYPLYKNFVSKEGIYRDIELVFSATCPSPYYSISIRRGRVNTFPWQDVEHKKYDYFIVDKNGDTLRRYTFIDEELISSDIHFGLRETQSEYQRRLDLILRKAP